MAHLGKNSNGHLTKTSTGHLEKCGECPSDCSGCADPITATVSNVGGTSDWCSDGGITYDTCDDMNGTWEMSYDGSCIWSATMDAANITLETQNGQWVFIIDCFSLGAKWVGASCADNPNCPPKTGWTWDSGNCTAGDLSLSW